MGSVLIPAAIFLGLNVAILFVTLILNRYTGRGERPKDVPTATPARIIESTSGQNVAGRCVRAVDILGWEFDYARACASEAMKDRLTMVNFYLLATGAIASGVIFALGDSARLPVFLGAPFSTVLLWLLCGIGWFHFLKIIRLRQAWHDSAETMNRIKEFCIEHAEDVEPDILRTAFRWRTSTLPGPDKPWTVFFYSSALIAFVDTAAYVAGGVLLGPETVLDAPLAVGGLLLFGLIFFAWHIWLYFAFLSSGQTR